MKIPFTDLKTINSSLKDDLIEAVRSVVESGIYLKGKQNEKLKDFLKEYLGVRHVIPVASGTDALFIALKSIGIGAGDEVITSSMSWIATSSAISLTGAKPVFVDVDDHCLINTKMIEAAITKRTKAILPVHLYGQSCDLDALHALCRTHHLKLIEDCAQSFSTRFKGSYTGTIGDLGAFSFYPTKNLGALGDAGCITTNNDDYARQCMLWSTNGSLSKNEHQIEGITSRMDEIQAAALFIKTKQLKHWNITRQKLAGIYLQKLKKIDSVEVISYHETSTDVIPHLMVISCKRRDQLMAFLNERGIETMIHYPTPLPLLKPYNTLKYDCSNAVRLQGRILSLPLHPGLSPNEIEYIAHTIQEFYSVNSPSNS